MLENTRRIIWSRLTGATTGASQCEVDRRHSDRAASRATVTCHAASAGLGPTPTPVRDVSRTGISFCLNRSLKPGTMVTFELADSAGASSAMLACVRHATAEPSGGWLIGCTFSAELSAEALAGFGVPRSAPAAGDQRRWVRATPTSDRAVVRRLSDHPSGPALMRVVDLSPAGIGLLTDHRLEPGALLDVELIGRDDRPGLTILACVVYVVERENGQWLTGCTFIRELSDAELQSWN